MPKKCMQLNLHSPLHPNELCLMKYKICLHSFLFRSAPDNFASYFLKGKNNSRNQRFLTEEIT
jgi:hypothetical protein